MNQTCRAWATASALILVGLLASTTQAEWRRYRITTHYGTPSVPVIRDTILVRDVFRPVVVSSVPLINSPAAVSSAPVITNYSAPGVYLPAPAPTVRGTFYAPAPRTYFYSAPARYNRVLVILP